MRTCSKCGAQYGGAEVFCPVDGARLVGTVEAKALELVIEEHEPDQYIGTTIQGRYRVLSRLGEGGMGVVYVAEHVEIEKRVALKLLRDDFSKRPEVVERFRQEARSASKIGHPHIVDVTDFGQLEDGGVFFAMECLEGQGLNDVVRGDPIPMPRAVSIVEQISRALQAAHDMGIVHRDLKPENIFLIERDGNPDFVKILDFGIAKISDRDNEGKRLTKTGMIFGTPEYMSPEQAAGKQLDHRVDVYALGCIMFEMFTGRVPFDGDSFMAVLTQHMFEPIPAIEEIMPQTDVPASVQAVVYKALAKEVDDRYATMEALRIDLERALTDANYIVEHPGRDTTVRIGTRGRVDPNKVDTLMDWAPPSGTFGPAGPGRKGKLLLAAIAVLVIAGGGVTAYVLGTRSGGSGDPIDPTTAALTTGGQAAGDDTGASGARVTPPDDVKPPEDDTGAPPPPETEPKIKVSVVSEPPGAVVEAEGMGQVCSAAPCELELAAGKPIKITGKLGKRKAEATFTPSDQNKELWLDLKPKATGGGRPKGGGGKKGDSGGGGKKGGDGKTPSGLKIPELFKDS